MQSLEGGEGGTQCRITTYHKHTLIPIQTVTTIRTISIGTITTGTEMAMAGLLCSGQTNGIQDGMLTITDGTTIVGGYIYDKATITKLSMSMTIIRGTMIGTGIGGRVTA